MWNNVGEDQMKKNMIGVKRKAQQEYWTKNLVTTPISQEGSTLGVVFRKKTQALHDRLRKKQQNIKKPATEREDYRQQQRKITLQAKNDNSRGDSYASKTTTVNETGFHSAHLLQTDWAVGVGGPSRWISRSVDVVIGCG